MTGEQIVKFRKEFFFQMEKKTSHGTNRIKEQFILCLNNVLLDNLEHEEKSG